jgi:hypothetical protein
LWTNYNFEKQQKTVCNSLKNSTGKKFLPSATVQDEMKQSTIFRLFEEMKELQNPVAATGRNAGKLTRTYTHQRAHKYA